jgi:hypothetical protein
VIFNMHDVLFGPLYLLQGSEATITPVNGNPVEVTVIDRTSGIETTDNVGVLTIRPAATIRIADLAEVGLVRKDLNRAELVMNCKTWRVENTMPKPTANGERDGELYLILIEI